MLPPARVKQPASAGRYRKPEGAAWRSLGLHDLDVLAAARAARLEGIRIQGLRPLLAELGRRHGLERDDQPVPASDDSLVPGLRGNRDPTLLEACLRIADQEVRPPLRPVVDLEVPAAAPGHHAL